MASFTRSHGANAKLPEWDDLLEEEQHKSTGSWLPLSALEEEFGGFPAQRPAIPGRREVGREIKPTAQHTVRAQGPPAATRTRPAASPMPWVRMLQGKAVTILAAGAICSLALYAAISATVEWAQVKIDDLQYGRPRTTQLDAYVGHNEANGVPTHFVAMNLNRRVTVMELPGGDSAKATAIVGPYLFGDGEDLTPIQATVQDLNGDDKPDLVLTVKNEQLFYLNDGANFKLASPEEQAAIEKSLSAATAKPGDAAAPEGAK